MISREIRHLMATGSAIRKMWNDGLRLKEKHGAANVADMTLGNPMLPPPEALTRALSEVVADPPADLHRYTPNAGHPEFRRAIAGDLDARGFLPGVRPEHVIATPGASAAINVALRTLLNPGDEVVILAPFFPDYPAHAANHQGVPVLVPTAPDGLPDLDALADAMEETTRVVIVNHPNNPSGREYPAEVLEGIADLLRERSALNGRPVYLLADEPYREIRYGTKPFVSAARVYEYGLLAYSWSKSLSLPGERIGYLAVNPKCPGATEIAHAAALANRILGFTNAPSLWQRVIAKVPDACVDITPYRRRRDALVKALRDRGYEVQQPEGTFYVFPRTPGGNDEAFVKAAMDDLLLLVPGGTFGRPGHFRIAFCTDDHSVELAVDRL